MYIVFKWLHQQMFYILWKIFENSGLIGPFLKFSQVQTRLEFIFSDIEWCVTCHCLLLWININVFLFYSWRCSVAQRTALWSYELRRWSTFARIKRAYSSIIANVVGCVFQVSRLQQTHKNLLEDCWQGAVDIGEMMEVDKLVVCTGNSRQWFSWEVTAPANST